jgi:hypothetical protein
MTAMQTVNVVILQSLVSDDIPRNCADVPAGGPLSLRRSSDLGAICALIGALLHVVGRIGVTMLFDVPRNEALAAVSPSHAGAANQWARFL